MQKTVPSKMLFQMEKYTSDKLVGIVKWFDREKGFGVVSNPKEGEFFFHINNSQNIPKQIPEGLPLIFEKIFDPKKERNSAINCRSAVESEDWGIIMTFLGGNDTVYIKTEVQIKEGNKYRSAYYRTVDYPYSLLELSAKQYLKGKTNSEISSVLETYYNDGLDKKNFILYCEFLEKVLPKVIDDAKTGIILENLYTYFKNNIDDQSLFYVWKHKRFKYILYHDLEDYPIDQKLLNPFYKEIDLEELRRISKYKYGFEYCDEFINSKIEKVHDLDTKSILAIYPFLEVLDEEMRINYMISLDNELAKKNLSEILELAKSLGKIERKYDYDRYEKLRGFILSQISERTKIEINNRIDELIVEYCAPEYLPELWLKGIVNQVPLDSLLTYFLNLSSISDFGLDNEADRKRLLILSKLQQEEQFKLLTYYLSKRGWLNGFRILESFLKQEKFLTDNSNLSDYLFDLQYWKENKCNCLIALFIDYFNSIATERDKFELFKSDYLKKFSLDYFRENLNELNQLDFEKVFCNLQDNKELILEILTLKLRDVNNDELRWMYGLAEKFLNINLLFQFDKSVLNIIGPGTYFDLWKEGIGKIFPESKYIDQLLDDSYLSYEVLDELIVKKIATQTQIAEFLFEYLQKQIEVSNRITFNKQLFHIKYLLTIGDAYDLKIYDIGNETYNISLWVLGKTDYFDFDILKGKFIYFSPEEQIKIIRKLLALKSRMNLI